MRTGVICCLLQTGRNCRMNSCLAFNRLVWTCANYSQSLKCLPAYRHWFYNIPVKPVCAAVQCNSVTVSSGHYADGVRGSVNPARLIQRYCTDKAGDKAEVTKESESPPGLLRRFHQTYKEHGKILVGVHLVTSAVWASIFYCAAVRLSCS